MVYTVGSTGQAWHPGVKGHKLRGDIISIHLLSILDDAIVTVLSHLQNTIQEVQRYKNENLNILKKYENELNDIKIPKICSKEICETSAHCYTNYEPKIRNSMNDIIIHKHNWSLELAWTDKRAVEKGMKYNLGYLDRKYIYTSDFNSVLSLLITPTRDGPVWLCELQKGTSKYPSTMGELDTAANVTISFDVKDIGNETLTTGS